MTLEMATIHIKVTCPLVDSDWKCKQIN